MQKGREYCGPSWHASRLSHCGGGFETPVFWAEVLAGDPPLPAGGSICAPLVPGALSCTPIELPETTSWTRRFSARPWLVELSATGSFFPYPAALMLFCATPCDAR